MSHLKAPPRLCEPNLYMPQRIDLDEMREEFALKAKVAEEIKKKEEIAKRPRIQEPIDSKIIPVFDKYRNHTKEMLSLKNNEYIREKYNRFLDSPAEKVVIVRLFWELNVQKPKPKPMTLNGNFYDIHNKLAPIPYIPDPRNYEMKSSSVGKSKKRNTA